jgi:hypothetical protein
MPGGPQVQKRPADVIGNAINFMRIATGEETEELETDRTKSAAAELGIRGGKARVPKMTPERRSEIAKRAAGKRWHVVRAIVTGLSFARRPLHDPGKEPRFSRARPDAQVTSRPE